ncbi:hypothetical protein [Mycobacterium sp.]|uniref:hypothetical protein n=1 Tax=Mycobacterium sp. TaxID=1785 RepID=UPI003F9A5A1B
MRVAQMGMGVVTVAARRGMFAANELGGDGGVGDRAGADGGGDKEMLIARFSLAVLTRGRFPGLAVIGR